MQPKASFTPILLALLSLAAPALAQQNERFPREITLYVGTEPGGGYDLNARMVARHKARHLPGNPTIIVQNMPGAGGLKLANYLYTVAPRDGSAFGILGPTVLLDPLLSGQASQFEAQKFTLLGSSANEVSTCIAWHTAKAQSMDALMTNELVVAATGPTSVSGLYPRVMNVMLGTHFKVVQGYNSSAEALLAMERGENEGFCGLGWTNLQQRPDWFEQGRVKVLVQLGLAKHKDHPDVPLVMDYAQNIIDGQVLELVFAPQVFARPFIAPPELPDERAAWLRLAFYATIDDPEFILDATRQKLEPELVKGDQIRYLLGRLYGFAPQIVGRAKQALQQ
jgi:tripartite-type tricarboxylate transporter receptor subunit TctC